MTGPWRTGRPGETWELEFEAGELMSELKSVAGDALELVKQLNEIFQLGRVVERIPPIERIQLQARLIRLQEVLSANGEDKNVRERPAPAEGKRTRRRVGSVRSGDNANPRKKRR